MYTLKAKLFPDSIFVVGYDTAIRLVDSKYYGGTVQMLLQFAELKHSRCRFLVSSTSTLLCKSHDLVSVRSEHSFKCKQRMLSAIICVLWRDHQQHSDSSARRATCLRISMGGSMPCGRHSSALQVAGRIADDGKSFKQLADIAIPEELAEMVSI